MNKEMSDDLVFAAGFGVTCAIGLYAFVTVLNSFSPDVPLHYIDVDAPDWVEDVNVSHVSRRSASIINDEGEVVSATRDWQRLNDDLEFSRSKRILYVRGNDDVTCLWNMGETLNRCRVDNPEFIEYRNSLAMR